MTSPDLGKLLPPQPHVSVGVNREIRARLAANCDQVVDVRPGLAGFQLPNKRLRNTFFSEHLAKFGLGHTRSLAALANLLAESWGVFFLGHRFSPR